MFLAGSRLHTKTSAYVITWFETGSALAHSTASSYTRSVPTLFSLCNTTVFLKINAYSFLYLYHNNTFKCPPKVALLEDPNGSSV